MRRHRKLLRRIFVAEAYRTYGNLSRFFIRVFAGVMFMQFGIRQIANYDFFVKYFPDLLGMGSAATLDTMIAIEVVCSAFLLFVGMFVFIMLAGPGKVSVDYLLSLYFTNKDSLNELKNF